MKPLLVAVGVLLGIFVLLSVVTATSLVGEVVTLHTRESGSEWQTTPLWIVEVADGVYLRAGTPDGSGWVTRLRANPEARLERGGELRDVRLVEAPALQETVNDAMAERYGWADAFVGLMREIDRTLPYRVETLPAAAAGG